MKSTRILSYCYSIYLFIPQIFAEQPLYERNNYVLEFYSELDMALALKVFTI